MRPASGCKLFGAYQALGGIQDGVVLLHSVVGCNFGSMSLHVAQDMRDIRQTCTVISDSDVVFSGEASLERAVRSALELFQPSVLFVVSGCVSEMIGDDIPAVLARIPHEAPLLHVEAAGFRGDAARGLEAGWLALLPLMKPPVPRPYPRPYPRSDPRPLVNLIGLGMDDPHAADDVEALRATAKHPFIPRQCDRAAHPVREIRAVDDLEGSQTFLQAALDWTGPLSSGNKILYGGRLLRLVVPVVESQALHRPGDLFKGGRAGPCEGALVLLQADDFHLAIVPDGNPAPRPTNLQQIGARALMG